MSFNIDPKKQSLKVMFSRKTSGKIHPRMFFNNILVSKSDCQKYLGLHLDSKLSFDILIKTILTKVNRTTASLQKLQHYLNNLLFLFTKLSVYPTQIMGGHFWLTSSIRECSSKNRSY